MKVICIDDRWQGTSAPDSPKMLEECTVIDTKNFPEGEFYQLAEYQFPAITVYYFSGNFAPLQSSTIDEKIKQKEPELVEA